MDRQIRIQTHTHTHTLTHTHTHTHTLYACFFHPSWEISVSSSACTSPYDHKATGEIMSKQILSPTTRVVL